MIPDIYVPTVYDIDYHGIYDDGIRYAIFDVDDTLLPADDVRIPSKLIELFDYLQQEIGFNTCLVSNGSKSRVKPVAQHLNVHYVAKAFKPLPQAFTDVQSFFNGQITASNTAFIGDSLALDMLFASNFKIYKILVDSTRENRWNLKTVSNDIMQAFVSIPLKNAGFELGHYYTKRTN